MRLKQLLPFRHATGYIHHHHDGGPVAEIATWRMWFGRVFRHKVTVLGPLGRDSDAS